MAGFWVEDKVKFEILHYVQNDKKEGDEIMNEVKYCKHFHCDSRRDRFCCFTCKQKKYCKNPCLNNPAKCGLEDKQYKEYKENLRRSKK